MKSEEEYKNILSEEEYKILREKGTEAPFTGAYVDTNIDGIYRCKACGTNLFSSNAKFNSNTGWPSFSDPIAKEAVVFTPDNSHGMHRTEVTCKNCESHLGHVFDGSEKGAKHFCINSTSLDLEES